MDKKLECLRCGNSMIFIKGEKLQLGGTGLLLGRFPSLVSDALEVDIYFCSECGKLEFYHTKDELLSKVQCPSCGKIHDKDYPKCPFCKYDYRAK
jgi:ssDNA-binding Zn-finger/Zn-ribbon topoisomerase 1